MIYDIQPRTGILVEMERNALQNGHSIKSVGSQGVTRDTQISRLQDTSSNQVTVKRDLLQCQKRPRSRDCKIPLPTR